MRNKFLAIIKFTGILLVILSGVFFLHTFLYEHIEAMYKNQFFSAYAVNFFLAITIFLVLILLKKKHTHLLGFAYLGGSLLKFLIFFIFFYPYYKADGTLDRMEGLTFLIPYFTCLIYETYYVVKMLNK